MISTDFAPNESWSDAILSLKLLFMPWLWKRGEALNEVKKNLAKHLSLNTNHSSISLFLSGRSALYYLLKSLNLPAGSQILVQAFTCEAVVLPIIELGLKPIYIDIESETFSMNFENLSNKLTNKTKVLVLQHTFGLTPKYREQILKLAQKHKMYIIEDLAHGFDPGVFKTDNRLLTTDHFYLLSFGRSKILSSVFGGAIATINNQQSTINNLSYPSNFFIFRCLLYKPLVMLIKSTYDIYLGKILHKILDSLGLLIPEITSKEKSGSYDNLFNKAYPNGFAILLLHQLNKLEETNKQRVEICKFYSLKTKLITKHSSLNTQSLIRYPLLIEDRDRILEEFKRKNIYLGRWYDQVVAPGELDLSRVGYQPGSCPKAEAICKKIINLPTNISESEAERVINTLSRA